MDLPITTFWFLNYTINRVRAEQDMRTLSVHANVQSTEGMTKYREHLALEMGEVITESKMISAERDHAGFEALRTLL
jgi:hypothetical protein